jgi:hypothetical protein
MMQHFAFIAISLSHQEPTITLMMHLPRQILRIGKMQKMLLGNTLLQ